MNTPLQPCAQGPDKPRWLTNPSKSGVLDVAYSGEAENSMCGCVESGGSVRNAASDVEPGPGTEARAAICLGRNGMLPETNVAERGEDDDDVAETLGECCGDVSAEDGKRWGELGVGNEMNDSIVLAVGMPEAIPGTVVNDGQYRDSSGNEPGPCSTGPPPPVVADTVAVAVTVAVMAVPHCPGRVWLAWFA